ncbi:DUF2787 domain-containing protein, partial [Vibrio sp. F13]
MSQTTPHRLLVEYLNALVEQLDVPTFAT